MHFKIFQINTEKIHKNDYFSSGHIFEDPLYLQRSDWGGDDVKGEDRTKALEYLKATLEPVARVSIRRKTIRFLSKRTVQRRYRRHITEEYKTLISNIKEGRCTHWLFQRNIQNLCGCDDLFYFGYCMTSSSIVEEYLNGYLPQVVHIGGILDAHA